MGKYVWWTFRDIFDSHPKYRSAFFFYDLIRDEKISNTILRSYYYAVNHQINFIGNKNLLITTLRGLFLFEIDHESWKLKLLLKCDYCFWNRLILIDELDHRESLAYTPSDFAAGKVSDGQIILNQPKEFSLPRSFYSPKLAGNRLISFTNLIELIEKTVKLPFSFEGDYIVYDVCLLVVFNLYDQFIELYVLLARKSFILPILWL